MERMMTRIRELEIDTKTRRRARQKKKEVVTMERQLQWGRWEV